MNTEIKEKLKTLREYYYEDNGSIKWIDMVEKNIRRLVALSDLAKNAAVIAIIDDARKRIDTINQFLSFDEEMGQEERKAFFKERDVHQFYLDRFEGRSIEARFERINGMLDEEIDKITDGKGQK